MLSFVDFFRIVLDKYSTVDVMINNAGIVHETEWRRCVEVNLVCI